MATIIEFTRGNEANRERWLTPLRLLFACLLLCFCLVKPSIAGNNYNNHDFRSMPFIEMMVSMMKAMNDMMNNNNSNYVPGLGSLPYSPGMAMVPGMANGLGGFNNLPMSPAGTIPLNNLMTNGQTNFLSDNFQTGQNSQNINNVSDFWNPKQLVNNTSSTSNSVFSNNTYKANSINGIWQSLSGDVIAIYKNSYFIWTDGKNRKLAGRLLIKGNNLVAYFPDSKKKLYFQFYKEVGQFIVRDQTSRIYTFKRLH
ncbi:MAG: hypothetical protein KZQ83_02885 [gamma proteobacterium symbiont of Taylorina sp.]|nr:hypothetical protein [gamma proteobacterium symbiont of Taylorina sp.]